MTFVAGIVTLSELDTNADIWLHESVSTGMLEDQGLEVSGLMPVGGGSVTLNPATRTSISEVPIPIVGKTACEVLKQCFQSVTLPTYLTFN